MKLSDFDFQLPDELIAQTPSPQRGESRLLVLDRSTQTIEHASFSDLPRYLERSSRHGVQRHPGSAGET